MHYTVLLAGNIVLAVITWLSYVMARKGLAAANNQVFVRMVYASTLSKLFLCLIGITIYVLVKRPDVSRATIFTLMFLYLVYTVVETLSLYKLLKRKT
jgi:ACR3 family arsenite efflux pump ArsB